MDAWIRSGGRIAVLGDFRAVGEGSLQTPQTRQVARLGALLASTPEVVVPRDRIVLALWGEAPPKTVVNTIQVHVSHLRSLLGSDQVRTAGQGYCLEVDPVQVDGEWFKTEVLECLAKSTAGDYSDVRQRLNEALSIWRGTPYEDLSDSTIEAKRSELEELRERAIEALLEASLEAADSTSELSEVIAAAKGQVARQPLRERGHELVIRGLIADGRLAEAHVSYERALDVLARHGGGGASPRLAEAMKAVQTPSGT